MKRSTRLDSARLAIDTRPRRGGVEDCCYLATAEMKQKRGWLRHRRRRRRHRRLLFTLYSRRRNTDSPHSLLDASASL